MQACSFLVLLMAVVTLFSCQNNAGEYSAMDRLSDSVSTTGLTGDSAKLVKTAGIHFKVKNVEQSTAAVSTLARKHGGMIYFQSFHAAESQRKELKVSQDSLLVISTYIPQAEITVRVPSSQLETFLYETASLGYHTDNAELKIDDKSLAYLSNLLKQKNRSELSAVPARRKNDAGTLQSLQVKDDAVDKFIENKSIDADAAYSTVSLHLFQNAIVRRETIANYVLADYDLPFGTKLAHALNHGWQAFLNLVVAFAHLWAFILLLAIAYSTYRYFQLQRKGLITADKTS